MNSKTEKKIRAISKRSAQEIARGMVARQLMEIRNWPWHRRAKLAWRILIGR